MRIDAKTALNRSKKYQSDELSNYRYLADEVALLETEVLQLVMDTADTGKTSVIYNFAIKDSESDKETHIKAKLMCEALHRLGFNTSIFFDDYEADYRTGYRVVIMWE